MSQARSSRQRYRNFLQDYKQRRLDDTEEPRQDPPASDASRPPRSRRREYLREYLRWLFPYRYAGGQRQRLAIARAILASPQILILDEATSNLDTESEQLIQASMATLLAGRSTFVIAHRLSTIRRADLILLMEEGRVIERGTHEQLTQARGAYRHMVLRQMESSGENVEVLWR